jgi:hypothetical protein
MGYRKRTGRYRKRGRNSNFDRSRSQGNSGSIAGELADLIADGIKWLWRLIRGRSASLSLVAPTQTSKRKISFREKLALLPAAPSDLPLPYCRCDRILSRGEHALWNPLYRAVKGRYRIFCKVRLYDVVRCPAHRADERRWFKKAGRYHVDFVICDPKTTAPLLVVELDDQSHRRSVRKERDAFKDQILAAAGMPVYRIVARQAYDPLELAGKIDRLIAEA